MKNTTEGNVDFMTRPSKVDWQDPRRGIDGQEGRGSSKMSHSCEASLREDVRTSLKTKDSTHEAGDPQSKMKSTRGSLGLYFCSAFLAPIVGYFGTKLGYLISEP